MTAKLVCPHATELLLDSTYELLFDAMQGSVLAFTV